MDEILDKATRVKREKEDRVRPERSNLRICKRRVISYENTVYGNCLAGTRTHLYSSAKLAPHHIMTKETRMKCDFIRTEQPI